MTAARALDTTTRADTALIEHAEAIRALGKRTIADIIEIGRRLAACKEIVGHGNWLPWIEREFGWTEMTATRFMNVHDMSKSNKLLDLDLNIGVSSLYLLAAPSTPEPVRTAVIERAEAGEKFTHEQVKRVIAEAITSPEGRKIIREAAKAATPVHGTQGTGDNEWYTPPGYIEAVRKALGTIDLDPASNDVAQQWIKARRYFTINDDGLKQQWRGRVWLNPPYSREMVPVFIDKLIDEIDAGRVTAAIMLTHNYTDTEWFLKAQARCDAICFTKGRIKFTKPDRQESAPTQGQAFFYFGEDVAAFADAFKAIGWGVTPLWNPLIREEESI
jgi:phage N-6-adenine-methyltransferase